MTFLWPTVGTVQLDGVRLGYREAGPRAGAPALLVHGTGSQAGTWDRCAARLVAAGHRVVAYDLRGHATSGRTGAYALRSLRDDLLGLMAALRMTGAVAVGHSVGAYAAVEAALHSPHRIARLVLEDISAPPQRPSAAVRGLQALTTAATVLTAGRRDHDWGVKASIFRQLAAPDPAWWERLHDVRQPALVLSGGPTSCIPPARLARVTDAMPDARLATIPVGHRVHSFAPDEFSAEIETFLAETAPVGLERAA